MARNPSSLTVLRYPRHLFEHNANLRESDEMILRGMERANAQEAFVLQGARAEIEVELSTLRLDGLDLESRSFPPIEPAAGKAGRTLAPGTEARAVWGTDADSQERLANVFSALVGKIPEGRSQA